jgi:galactonate dehydratase
MSEGLYSTAQYKPFLELSAIDIAMPDIAWVGLTEGKKIANQCATYHVAVTPHNPHNPHSPLCTLITAHYSSSIQNLLIQEIEVDDVPWRDKVISEPLRIKDGHLELNDKPGYGIEIDLEEIRKHPPKKSNIKNWINKKNIQYRFRYLK